MSAITLITAPTVEPVSLTEAKNHLRVDITEDDSLIGSLITAARQLVETQAHRQLVTATWKLSLDRFPTGRAWCNFAGAFLCADHQRAGTIEIPLPPLQSITSIAYVDSNGDTQTLDAEDYQVDTASSPGRVLPAYGESWPATRSQANAVEITFVAGYGNASTVPATAKAAIKLLLGNLYENREATVIGNITSELPMAVQALIGQLRWGAYS